MDIRPFSKFRTESNLNHKESITSVASIGIDAGEATLSHGSDQCLKSVLRDHLPLLLQSLEQDVEVWWRRRIRSDPWPQDILNIPKVLDWVEMERTGGPVHQVATLFLKPCPK